jgi:hypothetical protein
VICRWSFDQGGTDHQSGNSQGARIEITETLARANDVLDEAELYYLFVVNGVGRVFVRTELIF